MYCQSYRYSGWHRDKGVGVVSSHRDRMQKPPQRRFRWRHMEYIAFVLHWPGTTRRYIVYRQIPRVYPGTARWDKLCTELVNHPYIHCVRPGQAQTSTVLQHNWGRWRPQLTV